MKTTPRYDIRVRLSKTLLHLILILGAIICLFPFFWMVGVSLMAPGEAIQSPPPLLPKTPTLENFRTIFTRLAVGRYILNSLLISTLITSFSLFICSMAGYAFAKWRFRGKDTLFRSLLVGLAIPGQITMLPLFLMMREMGILNTYAAAIIPGLASIYAIFLFRQQMLIIPDSLIEAARIDGGSELYIYRRIILPLAKPTLITLGVFTFLGAWNDFMWPLIVFSDQTMYTLPVALANLMGEHLLDIEWMVAGATLAIMPVVVIFLFLQRYYLQGMIATGIKE